MELICDYDCCTGCQVCKNVCPTGAVEMHVDKRGFIYPEIDESSCIDCHKCQKHCPALDTKKLFHKPLEVFAGWVKDEQNRWHSTSGGASYALSKMIVEKGGIFYGVRWNIDHAEHSSAKTISELEQFQGSKYIYSYIGNCYKDIKLHLNEGRIVLFVGTGCQVAGLYSFLQKDYPNLITVDILCHGFPSLRALGDRIKDIEEENCKRLVNLRFRDKDIDQYHTCMKYTFEDGSFVKHSEYQDFFSRGFDSNYLLRPNCFKCQYAQEKRVSDITIADFWGYKPKSIKSRSFRRGTSLLLVNTTKGLDIVKELSNFKLEHRLMEEAKPYQTNLSHPQIKPEEYEEFWNRYTQGESFEELAHIYFPPIPIPTVCKNNWLSYLKMIFGEKTIKKISGIIK